MLLAKGIFREETVPISPLFTLHDEFGNRFILRFARKVPFANTIF